MNSRRTNDWIRPAVQDMSAYQVADAKGMIKLDAMENPYCLPPELVEQWVVSVQEAELNRYPDSGAGRLKQTIRLFLDLPKSTGLILGNGSDEIIQMLALAFGGQDSCFMSVEPTFVMYRIIAEMSGLAYECVNLKDKDFSLDLSATVQAIKEIQPAVVFIATPNNPTGNIHDLDDLRQLAQACPGVMVIDEAYAPFTDMTAEALLDEFSHVLIMRTVSKMGLAGLRLGYLMGDAGWIDEIEKVRLPYNINVLTQCTAVFALENKAVFDDQAELIRFARADLYASLSELPDLTVWPSEANFILFRTDAAESLKVFEALKQKGILIKSLDAGHDLLQNCLRVTVGTDEENRCFIAALKEILAEGVGSV